MTCKWQFVTSVVSTDDMLCSLNKWIPLGSRQYKSKSHFHSIFGQSTSLSSSSCLHFPSTLTVTPNSQGHGTERCNRACIALETLEVQIHFMVNSCSILQGQWSSIIYILPGRVKATEIGNKKKRAQKRYTQTLKNKKMIFNITPKHNQ